MDKLPGSDDVAFYREHGYWISPLILPPEVLDAAERGMRRFYAGDHDHELPDLPTTRGWQPSDGDVLRKNDYTSLRVVRAGPSSADRCDRRCSVRRRRDPAVARPVALETCRPRG
jgi:hypothetical protein